MFPMKNHHLVLILLLAVIAAVFLNQTRNLKSRESAVREELDLLRDAVSKSPGTAASSLTGRKPRQPAIDSAKFAAGLADILKRGPGTETRKSVGNYLTEYQAQLATASSSKLKEICELIERDFPPGQADSEPARGAWLYLVGRAAQSDPAWAFAKLGQAASTANAPIDAVLEGFKKWSSPDGEPMNLSYAAALKKWLDTAQVEGRIEERDPLVAELRAGIAAAQGNSSDAAKQISLLPYMSQKEAAIECVAGLQTPEAQRQAMKEFSTSLHAQNFPEFVRSLANQQGFEAVREILDSASLLPEKHDMAAASIAAADIGSETNARAAWLLENLKTNGHRALEEFTERWTGNNHADAANWISSLQPGPKRDAALKGFIPTAARIDGATSMDWALTVSDPLLRNQMYAESYMKWAETDSDQANIYRNAHPLDREALDAHSK